MRNRALEWILGGLVIGCLVCLAVARALQMLAG